MKTTLHKGFCKLGLALTLLSLATAGIQAHAAEFYFGGGLARHAVDGGFDGKTVYTTTFSDSNESALAGKVQPGNGLELELGVLGDNHLFFDFQTSRTWHQATHYLSNDDSKGTVAETALTLGYALPITPTVSVYAGLGLANYDVTLSRYFTSFTGKHYAVDFQEKPANSLPTTRYATGVWYRFENSLAVRAGIARGSAIFASASGHGTSFTLRPTIDPDIYTADVSVLYLFSGGK